MCPNNRLLGYSSPLFVVTQVGLECRPLDNSGVNICEQDAQTPIRRCTMLEGFNYEPETFAIAGKHVHPPAMSRGHAEHAPPRLRPSRTAAWSVYARQFGAYRFLLWPI